MQRLAVVTAGTGLVLLLSACVSPSPTPPRTSRPVPRAGCPSPQLLSGAGGVSVDYVDFVFHDGVSFLNTSLAGGPAVAPIPAGDVGPVLFRVTCNFSAFTSSGRVQPPALVEDSSGRLPVGSAVHTVRGFLPSCRLTAAVHGRWTAYLAQHEVDGVSATQPCALRPAG